MSQVRNSKKVLHLWHIQEERTRMPRAHEKLSLSTPPYLTGEIGIKYKLRSALSFGEKISKYDNS